MAWVPSSEHSGTMTLDLEELLALWSEPQQDPAAAFARLYTDPVSVNGASLTIADLVARSDALQATFADVRREVLDVCQGDHKVAVAFRITGRQVGPLSTSAGVVPATGRDISLRVIDVLTLTEGRISSLWMVADELGALAQVGAVALLAPAQVPASPG
jgi:SnoaL-like polyketide cyclase